MCLHEPPWTKRPMTAYSSRSVAACSPVRIHSREFSQGACEGGHAALASSLRPGSRWDDYRDASRAEGTLGMVLEGRRSTGQGVSGVYRVAGRGGDDLISPARGVHNRSW